MLANHGNTEGLFRGAFMQSGPPLPYGDISKGQGHYDDLVAKAGCQNATDSLQCLREVPSSVIQDAMNSTPSILDKEVRLMVLLRDIRILIVSVDKAFNITWVPRADGSFLRDPPMQAVLKDYIADIPFVSGVSLRAISRETQSHIPCIGMRRRRDVIHAVANQYNVSSIMLVSLCST